MAKIKYSLVQLSFRNCFRYLGLDEKLLLGAALSIERFKQEVEQLCGRRVTTKKIGSSPRLSQSSGKNSTI